MQVMEHEVTDLQLDRMATAIYSLRVRAINKVPPPTVDTPPSHVGKGLSSAS